MAKIMVMLGVFLLLLSTHVQGGEREQWDEPGNQQSPINIETAYVQPNNNLGKLNTEYLTATATLKNLGHEIQVAWSEYAGKVEIEGTVFELKQCHWHHPSEHTIDGQQYPLELHMVHQTDDNKIAVIGIIYKNGTRDPFLTTLQDAIEKISIQEEVELGFVNANEIGVESKAAYYRYNGSLTTPPYTEGVTWTVIQQVRTVSPEQVDNLQRALNGENNSRPVQPINGRTVEFFNPESLDIMELSEIFEAERTVL